MKIAIIGAGLCGVALAYYLVERGIGEIHLFDEHGVAGGASGIAAGLVHPYAGEKAKRSWFADEALRATAELLQLVPSASLGYPGILRLSCNRVEHQYLQSALLQHDDVQECNGAFFIKSGTTVDVSCYLHGLWKVCVERGARLFQQKIQHLAMLQQYDRIAVTAGAGSTQFSECRHLKVQQTKGQLLYGKLKLSAPLERSLVGKGYVGVRRCPDSYVLGSTYEKNFHSHLPDLDVAKQEILPKIATFFPQVAEFQIEDCVAGIRVARKGHYLPIIQRVGNKQWVCTGLGSRGLLYHAMVAKNLCKALLADDETVIEQPWKQES